jgi:predicted RND superfamily exporter protein
MTLREFGYSLGKAQSRKPWLFVLLALIITAATLPGIPLLLKHVEPSLEKVLPQDIEEVKVMNDMRSQYGADMLYVVLETRGPTYDVYDPDTLRYIDALSESLRGVDNVKQVMSVADIIKEGAATSQDPAGALPLDKQTTLAIAGRDSRVQQYVGADRSLTVIMVRADTGASASTVKRVLQDIRFTIMTLESENPGVDVSVTGFGAIDQATFSVIVSDFSRITLISFALMVAFLLVYYWFDIKKTVYSMLIMVLSLIWALGVTGYLGIQLNVVTMVAAAMIMALGSSYGINSVYHFYDDFLLQYPREEAIAKFQEFLIVGLTGSALAEIAGFLALLFGIMPSMRSLGIILAIGIFFALVVSVVVLPAFFALLEKDGQGSPATLRRTKGKTVD